MKTVLFGLILVFASALFAFQKPFRQYPGMEYEDFSLPPDYQQKAEFVFARLMYPDGPRGFGFGFGFFGRRGDWRKGYTSWTNDYPRADRHLMVALRRLTRISARSVEQPVNLEDGDDVYNWPFLYMVRAGNAEFTEQQILKLRDFIQRGGFLVCDDIWGEREYESLAATMSRVLPGTEILDLENSDPAFHTVFDLDHRYQISGQWSLGSGIPYLNGGRVPHWRGIYDEHKRLIVAVWVNNDTGDSWEWADDPSYPERYSALGIRMVVNHIVYAMTH